METKIAVPNATNLRLAIVNEDPRAIHGVPCAAKSPWPPGTLTNTLHGARSPI
jgi:hypothetical protein